MQVPDRADVLVGVIPRFITSGVTPPTRPAAVDTTAPQQRAWVAVWNGDPPASPTLPPDALIVPLETLQPGGGNWMIRAFGTLAEPAAPYSVPATQAVTLGVLALLLALTSLRRRTV